MLYGRSQEVAEIDRLLATVRSGRSAALVIRGEAGIGKSALLRYAEKRAEEHADPMTVLRGSGVESESELPYAGLHLLLGRATDGLDRLPDVQARALRGALGLSAPSSDGTSRFLVGLAVLTLLDALAEPGPVLCLVDDAQWLDTASAEALLFAARRLETEGVALVFAVREPHAPSLPTPGLPELRPAALGPSDAASLLAASADLAPDVRDRIVAEARGNPLALLALAETPSAGSRVAQVFADRLAALPEATRRVLLVAAADDTGDAAIVLGAAERLGVAATDLEPAEEAGLLRIDGDDVVFGHPLIRTAASQRAHTRQRQEVHRVLADVLGERGDVDRRAWHLAMAATGPDETAAGALEETAGRARARGGLAAVAAALERAAALSPDPTDRTRRRLDAARAAADAGRFESAGALLDAAEPMDDLRLRARAAKIRAVLPPAYRQGRDPHELLVEVALKTPDEAADQPLWHDIVRTAWAAGDVATLTRVAACGHSLPAAATLAEAVLATTDGRVEPIRRLLESEPPGDLRRSIAHARLQLAVADVETALRLAIRLEGEAREIGAIGVLPEILVVRARAELVLGRHHDASATATDGRRIAFDTDQTQPARELAATLAELAAIRGDEQRCRELVPDMTDAVALSLLDLGLGRYDDALHRLETATSVGALPVLVEAAARAGRRERASDPARRFGEWAAAIGRPEIDAIALRSRALAEDDPGLLEKAASMPAFPFERARTALLLGERLRRDRHMVDARTRLRSALETFERLGAAPWAERTRGELRATGETRAVRDHAPLPVDRLTPQELQVVRLAATGASNREIGARLFLSPRTVGHHLYRAFPKLGVASRTELAGLDL